MPMPPPPPAATPMMPEAAPATDTFIRRHCFLADDTATAPAPEKRTSFFKYHSVVGILLSLIPITFHSVVIIIYHPHVTCSGYEFVACSSCSLFACVCEYSERVSSLSRSLGVRVEATSVSPSRLSQKDCCTTNTDIEQGTTRADADDDGMAALRHARAW